MRYSYEAAALIRTLIDAEYGIDEVDWDSEQVQRCLIKYSRTTLLHYYICANIAVAERRFFRKDVDELDQVEEYTGRFEVYKIPYSPIQESDDDDVFFEWFNQNETSFAKAWEILTDEVFQLLFRDRCILREFGLMVADHLKNGHVNLPAEFIADNGYLRRDGFFPAWLRKGVFMRDQGLCVV